MWQESRGELGRSRQRSENALVARVRVRCVRHVHVLVIVELHGPRAQGACNWARSSIPSQHGPQSHEAGSGSYDTLADLEGYTSNQRKRGCGRD